MLISFDLRAEGAVFKKPDINEGIYLTYNMLHKPALLGILGAIIGLKGFEKSNRFPEYYEKLSSLKIGIQPLAGASDKGNFTKYALQYNNGVGYASQEVGGNLIVQEQTLFQPGYRCYLLLDPDNPIHQQLKIALHSYEAEYLPYLGKNEFGAWWEEVREWEYEAFDKSGDFTIQSLFVRSGTLRKQTAKPSISFRSKGNTHHGSFMFFERLPIAYDMVLRQYLYEEFAYTDWLIGKESDFDDIYLLNGLGASGNTLSTIQLF